MTRIACLYVPLFSLAARLRSEPELREEAVVIVDGNGNNAHVVAATRRARSKGIRAGHSLAQARSILPKLIARGRDSECERTAQEALLEVGETLSPRIEDAGEGVIYFDVSGMERHFADDLTESGAVTEGDSSVRCEMRLARAAIRGAESVSLPARCGIARSKLAARIAAEVPKSPTVVTAGDEANFLAPLPLQCLSPEMGAAAMLERWGLHSIGDLARLPEAEVASRLGELGRALHIAARGIDPQPLMPRPMPPEFREGMDLEWPLVAIEPFLFIASSALDRLASRMELQGFACRRLELTMTLDPDGFHARAIELPAPTRDVKTMLTLLRLDLEKNPPGAPVAGFSLVAHPDRPRRAQLSLFGPAALAPEKLATTIARLVSLLGEGRVGMAVTVDGFLPERFSIGEYAPPPPPEMKRTPKRSRGLLGVRVFRPPIPVEVIQHEDAITALHAVVAVAPAEPARGANGRISVGDTSEISGDVRVASGPWRLEDGWWGEQPASRDYWDVELTRGGVYRLYRDAGTNDWFVDARYDGHDSIT